MLHLNLKFSFYSVSVLRIQLGIGRKDASCLRCYENVRCARVLSKAVVFAGLGKGKSFVVALEMASGGRGAAVGAIRLISAGLPKQSNRRLRSRRQIKEA